MNAIRSPQPRHRRLSIGCAMLLLCLGAAPTLRANTQCERPAGLFSIYFENDIFANTDQNYTNGVKLAWVSPPLSQYRNNRYLQPWQRFVIDNLSFANDILTGDRGDSEKATVCDQFGLRAVDSGGVFRRVAFSLGQNIYTPENIAASHLISDGRPYAGWLYASAAFHTYDKRRLDVMEVQLGVVGPWSGAQPVQTIVHRLRGNQKPNGWEHQLSNEPGVVLTYEQRRRLLAIEFDGNRSGLGADLIPRFGFALGNVHTYGTFGAEARAGWNLPRDFGNAVIRPAGSAGRIGRTKGFSAQLFASADVKVVGRDIFLDGNTFGNSHSVTKRDLVADFSVGAALAYDDIKLTLSRVLRTREFEEQDGPHRFGSLTLNIPF